MEPSMYSSLEQIPDNELIAEIERRAYKRGYDAGRKYTWHMRNNDRIAAAQNRLEQLADDINILTTKRKWGNRPAKR